MYTGVFRQYERVAVKVGDDESHIYDSKRLMLTEATEIERVTGLSYAEWQQGLARFSITSVAALLHVLRKRAGTPSDFGSLQLNVADLAVIPLGPDDREMTDLEVRDDLAARVAVLEQAAAAATAEPVTAAS